mmetsp:Transcript_18236/g.24368  ORF Transcript_18236/g.24368 Transcript_18236/m.24368 type:complete len:97 (+) Transcript_18236:170-460(+)
MDLVEANTSSTPYITSYVLSCLSLGCIAILLLLTRFYLMPRYDLLAQYEVRRRIGSLYLGLNLHSKPVALMRTEWYLVRRLIYAFIAFIPRKHNWL